MSGHDLGHYILYESSNITLSYIQKLFDNDGIKKADIPIFITQFVCSHNLTENIWMIDRVKRYFVEIDLCKPAVDKDKIVKLFYGLCHLLGVCDKQHFVFFNSDERPDIFRNDVMSIMVHSSVATFDNITQLQDVVTEEVYKLFCILFDQLLYAVETKEVLQQTFVILRYLFALPNKQSFKNLACKLDMIDLVFLICIIYSNHHLCSKDSANYIECMKDIFYYKLKKKDKKKRLNILFYLFHVLIKRHVYSQPIDYEGSIYFDEFSTTQQNELTHEQGDNTQLGIENKSVEDKSIDDNQQKEVSRSQRQSKQHVDTLNEKVVKKCKYLYLYTVKNEELEMQMKYEREQQRMLSQIYRVRTKEIDVDHLLFKDPRNTVNVTRLQYK
jgi:hypothetical protein